MEVEVFGWDSPAWVASLAASAVGARVTHEPGWAASAAMSGMLAKVDLAA
jgi:hypothetical protein